MYDRSKWPLTVSRTYRTRKKMLLQTARFPMKIAQKHVSLPTDIQTEIKMRPFSASLAYETRRYAKFLFS